MKNNNARTAIVIWVFAATALIIKHHAWHLIPLTFALIALWAILNLSTIDNDDAEERGLDGAIFWPAIGIALLTEIFVLIFGG